MPSFKDGKQVAGATGGVFESNNLGLYNYGRNNPVILKDPDGNIVPLLLAAWAVYEVGSAAYDVYTAGATLLDPKATRAEKSIAVGGAILSIAAPGGGYGTAGKAANRGLKNADEIAEGRKFEIEQLQSARDEGKNVSGRNRLVPQNEIGNVKGNRTDTDQLIKNGDGTFSIVETKRSSSTRQSTGQNAAQEHVKSGGGRFEVRTNQPSQGLRKGDIIEIREYNRINKHE